MVNKVFALRVEMSLLHVLVDGFTTVGKKSFAR